ncbi:hypothetical protein IFM89_002136 [Coptis chinensis]|uniref:Polyphenol oxidase C-terminal domain-containing protein n=1 Tax=Coptis chinensis TaxID=261450 RepID=A0A835LCG3_9MAGN|nr:hypothetical protein IFM89_002136 [Coptis chinensis]
MAFNLATKAAFSPLGQYHQHRAKGSAFRPHVLGIRTKSLLHTTCELKRRKKGNGHSTLTTRNVLIGLEHFLGFATTILSKGVIESLSDDQNNSDNEQLDVEPSQKQPVSEFGLSPRRLDTVIRTLVKRPKIKREMEILAINGVENLEREEGRFDVYITKSVGDMVGPDFGEFVGNELDLVYQRNRWTGSLELDITHLVEAIGAKDSECIVVTLVPKTGKVIIGGVQIMAKHGALEAELFYENK